MRMSNLCRAVGRAPKTLQLGEHSCEGGQLFTEIT